MFLFQSCGHKESSSLSKEKMKEILIDIHFADATLLTQGYHDRKLNNDSLSYYNYIFKKHHINQQQFEDAVKYYAAYPNEYSKIYDEVINEITLITDSLIEKSSNDTTKIKDKNDIWNQKTSWTTPTDGGNQPIAYKIPISKHGTYTLSADILMFPDDGTVTPRMSMYLFYKDGTCNVIEELTNKKDGEWRNYSVKIVTNREKEVDYIKGWVLDHNEGTKNKHSYVQNISLIYKDDTKQEKLFKKSKNQLRRKKLKKTEQ